MKNIENSSTIIQDTDIVLDQILDKAKPFLKSSLKKWIDEQTLKEEAVDNFFELTFNEFLKLSPQDKKKWRHHVLINHKEWLNRQITIFNAEWLLVLGGKIEKSSSTLDDFPTKNDVHQLAKAKGFAPFIYVKDPRIEESINLIFVDRYHFASAA